MKDNKKGIYFILAVICIILIIVGAFIISDKRLDIEGELVTDLYKYLGETDMYHCGGLNTYSGELVTKDNITNDNKLCMAYFNLNNLNKEIAKVDGNNEYGTKICKVGQGTTLATSDEAESVCEYCQVDKNDLNKSFKEIYGEEIEDYKKFFTSNNQSCVLEEDTYYCGYSETFNVAILDEEIANSVIYRGISKAIKKFNGDVVIYDYFLRITGDKCYDSNTNNSENVECSEALKNNNNINSKFMSKYGILYKHTFKKDSNDNLYWLKSERNN